MNIVLIGIQGCGKGTLVSGLEQHLDFDLISVGQLLRDEVATGSELGKHIKEIQMAGKLVELETVMKAVNNKLNSSTKEIRIFDGFPRSSEQADELDKITKVDLVLHLVLSKVVAVDRILNRLTCSTCGYITKKQEVKSNVCSKCGGKLAVRSDDTLETINKRFEQYYKETEPILDRYKARGVVVDITAVMGLQHYYQMKAELELLRTLAEAEEDVVNGRVAPVQNTFDDIRESLLER